MTCSSVKGLPGTEVTGESATLKIGAQRMQPACAMAAAAIGRPRRQARQNPHEIPPRRCFRLRFRRRGPLRRACEPANEQHTIAPRHFTLCDAPYTRGKRSDPSRPGSGPRRPCGSGFRRWMCKLTFCSRSANRGSLPSPLRRDGRMDAGRRAGGRSAPALQVIDLGAWASESYRVPSTDESRPRRLGPDARRAPRPRHRVTPARHAARRSATPWLRARSDAETSCASPPTH